MRTRIMQQRPRWNRIILGMALLCLPVSQLAAQGPILEPIAKGTIRVDLQPVVSGLTSPGDVRSAPDGSGRLFITDQAGKVVLVKSGVAQATPFLDVSSRLVPLNAPYDERGLLGFAVHPDFANPNAAGYRTVYSYSSEPLNGPADFTVPMPAGAAFDHQGVIAEWKVNPANPDVIEPSTRREVMRFDEPQFNHNGGTMAFGPDHNLYIALGDGGNADDVGDGHNPTTGNAQDRSTILGKVLRINPLGTGSANNRYGIPANNPFVGTAGVFPEIYAYGFRNPFRFSFDRTGGDLILADVGQNKYRGNRSRHGRRKLWLAPQGRDL